ncbi:MAG: hypothetical protein WBD28_03665, partial [Candidatus Zixiibacteriota bacterium]
PEEDISWGFDFYENSQILYKDADEVSSGRENLINNRSFIVAIQFAGKKILFPGDMEVEGWKKAFYYSKIKSILKDTNFFVASHHGHKSGFTSKILEYTGKPDIYIVPARSGDEDVDTAYSKAELSKGFLVVGDTKPARMISTGQIGSSIKIIIDESGECSLSKVDTQDNLSEHQKKILARRKRRIFRNWGY